MTYLPPCIWWEFLFKMNFQRVRFPQFNQQRQMLGLANAISAVSGLRRTDSRLKLRRPSGSFFAASMCSRLNVRRRFSLSIWTLYIYLHIVDSSPDQKSITDSLSSTTKEKTVTDTSVSSPLRFSAVSYRTAPANASRRRRCSRGRATSASTRGSRTVITRICMVYKRVKQRKNNDRSTVVRSAAVLEIGARAAPRRVQCDS